MLNKCSFLPSLSWCLRLQVPRNRVEKQPLHLGTITKGAWKRQNNPVNRASCACAICLLHVLFILRAFFIMQRSDFARGGGCFPSQWAPGPWRFLLAVFLNDSSCLPRWVNTGHITSLDLFYDLPYEGRQLCDFPKLTLSPKALWVLRYLAVISPLVYGSAICRLGPVHLPWVCWSQLVLSLRSLIVKLSRILCAGYTLVAWNWLRRKYLPPHRSANATNQGVLTPESWLLNINHITSTGSLGLGPIIVVSCFSDPREAVFLPVWAPGPLLLASRKN